MDTDTDEPLDHDPPDGEDDPVEEPAVTELLGSVLVPGARDFPANESKDAAAPPVSRPVEIGGAMALILLAVSVMYASVAQGLGSISQPDPGLWPFVVSVGLLLSAASALFIKPQAKRPQLPALVRVLSIAAVLFAFVFLYDYMGFIIPAMLFMFYLLKVIGAESWLMSLSVTIGGTLASYGLFAIILDVGLRAFW